ncbi:MAG: hypothetical protein H0W34_03510 [Pyrinomonadaceae bacterium]|nr:hypothetical protein [Pyrinomonadaceae bacterium]
MLRFLRARAFVLALVMLQWGILTTAAQEGPQVEVYSAGGATEDSGGDIDAAPVWRVPLDIKVSVTGGYDDNARTRSSENGGSFFTTAGLNLKYNFGTPRTRASLTSNAGFTYYTAADRFDPNLAANLSVQHAVSERLSLSGNFDARYKIEPDFEIEGSSNRRSGNYFFNRDELSASYRWLPRVSTVTSYSFDTLQYEQTTAGEVRDRYQHRFNQSLRYLLLPTISLNGSYSLSLVNYEVDDRDSITHSILAGVSSSIGPHLTASASAGAQFHSSDRRAIAGSESAVSPSFQANLTYTLGPETTLMWDARYGIEATSASSRGSGTFRTGLRLTYPLTARIGSSVAAYYRRYGSGATDVDLLDDAGRSEVFDLSINGHYKISPSWRATASWHYTTVDSDRRFGFDGDSNSYSRNRYSLGLTVTF